MSETVNTKEILVISNSLRYKLVVLGAFATFPEFAAAHPTGAEGSAYMVANDLYIWDVDDSAWANVGQLTDRAIVNDLGVVTENIVINPTEGRLVKATIGTSVSVSLAAPDSAGASLYLHFTNAGAYAITWPTNLVWLGGSAPALQAEGDDLIYLQTDNGGAVWLAANMIGGGNAGGGGEGGGEIGGLDPDDGIYYIYTARDLANFRDIVNSGGADINARVMHDIDLSSVCGGEQSWEPIGFCLDEADDRIGYTGTFDGGGHIISNLYIYEPSLQGRGLFGGLSSGGEIKNTAVQGSICCLENSAGLCAIVRNGKITACQAKVTITSTAVARYYRIGGLAARVFDGSEISNCYSACEFVSSTTTGRGGVAAKIANSKLENCVGACFFSTKTEYDSGVIPEMAKTSNTSSLYINIPVCLQNNFTDLHDEKQASNVKHGVFYTVSDSASNIATVRNNGYHSDISVSAPYRGTPPIAIGADALPAVTVLLQAQSIKGSAVVAPQIYPLLACAAEKGKLVYNWHAEDPTMLSISDNTSPTPTVTALKNGRTRLFCNVTRMFGDTAHTVSANVAAEL